MERGYFRQEIFLCGTKGYLKSEGVTVKGCILENDSVQSSPKSQESKEVLLYEDSEDGDLLHMERLNSKQREPSPLLPQIYMTGE